METITVSLMLMVYQLHLKVEFLTILLWSHFFAMATYCTTAATYYCISSTYCNCSRIMTLEFQRKSQHTTRCRRILKQDWSVFSVRVGVPSLCSLCVRRQHCETERGRQRHFASPFAVQPKKSVLSVIGGGLIWSGKVYEWIVWEIF